MSASIEILGIAGSLRRDSYNAAAIRAAGEVAPEGVTVQPFALDDIPLYNDDVRERGFPAPVSALRDAIAASDALLIATPEYNYSVPGVLKNAIDWASRPPEQPFEKKIIGILGASPGRLGTARAQYHLRQCFVFLDARLLNKPEVMIGGAGSVFDDTGRLTDETTRGFMGDLVAAIANAVREQR